MARWGGEEFCILLPDAGAESAHMTLERVRAVIEDLATRDSNGNTLKVTASIGFSSSNGKPEIATLLRQADEVLYEAKAEGRNQVVGWTDSRE